MESELYELIPKVLADYRAYFDKQAHYRAVIRSEKERFQVNARNVFEETERIAAAAAECEESSR